MRRLVSLITIIGTSFGCGDSPQAPTPPPSPAPTVVTVSSLSVSGTAPLVGAAAQFASTATLSNGTTQNVTSQAAWASSNTAVATVAGAGLVTGVGEGEADITATYQSVAGRSHVTIARAPIRTFTVTGLLTDGTSGGVLPNIYVQANDSAGNGAATRTSGFGTYSIGGLMPGAVVLTASATSYETATRTVAISEDTRVDIVLTRTPPPPPECTYVVSNGFISRMGFTNVSPNVQTSLPACPWTATSDDAWLVLVEGGVVVPSISRTGSGSVPVAANANLHQDRTGTIRIRFQGGEVVGQVTQPGFGLP